MALDDSSYSLGTFGQNFAGEGPPVVDIVSTRPRLRGQAHLRNQGYRSNIANRDGRIHLNQLYLVPRLTQADSDDLLDTIMHEGSHFSEPWILQGAENNFDHAYINPLAAKLTKKYLNKYNKLRAKLCNCGGK